MYRFIIILLALFTSDQMLAQQRLVFETVDEKEQKIIDSVYFSSKKLNLKQIESQAKNVQEQLFRKGFLSHIVIPKKSTDSIFNYQVYLGQRITHIYVSISETLQRELSLKEIEKINISQIDTQILKIQQKYDALGFNFHKISIRNFKQKDNFLHAELILEKSNQRQLQEVVWQGMEKFPKNHQKFIKKSFGQKPFSQDLLKRLEIEVENFSFCQLVNSPEVLFGVDSTKIYLTVDKTKNNQFDGYAGFSTDDDNNFRLNGHLDLSLTNILGSGEYLNVFWRNNGEDQTQFQAKLALPYLFGSRFTSLTELYIIQQDSTFQNSQTKFHLGYHLPKGQRIFLGYDALNSNNISNSQNRLLNDFESTFGLLTYTNYPTLINVFDNIENFYVFCEFGYGQRKDMNQSYNQLRFRINTEKNIKLKEKQFLSLRNENFYLLSDNYLTNELHRFGGNQSLRGYLENSLQANQYHSLLTEYQYFFNPSFYLHSITDYGYFKDQTTNFSAQVISSGLGFGLASKNGVLKFNYAAPVVGQDGFSFSKSIVHIQFRSVF